MTCPHHYLPPPCGVPSADPVGRSLLPYQRYWVADRSRWKFALQARQTGKDFTAAAEGIRDCQFAELAKRQATWIVAAPSERQSLEALAKWREWTGGYQQSLTEQVAQGGPPRPAASRLRLALLAFPRGSRVLAVPGKPATVRGYSANVVLTEALFFEDFAATWRALVPMAGNPLRGGMKKLRLLTTPNGAGGPGHELWRHNYQAPEAGWTCQRVTIHAAVGQGLPIDLEQMRRTLNDPEGWAQEYELEFLDQSRVLLPYDVIAACEHPDATETAPEDDWAAITPAPRTEALVLGIDFGRKKDLTVCWALVGLEGGWKMTREVLELPGMASDRQLEILTPRIRRARRVCFDYTGPGVGLGDHLARQFGEYHPERHLYGKIELCQFTNAFKVEIFSKLRMEFDRRGVAVPGSRVIREDLHSLQRVSLPTGGIAYRAGHNEAGHADRATALALAVRALTETTGTFAYSPVARTAPTAAAAHAGLTGVSRDRRGAPR